jgi:hypothetical protein
MSVTPEYYQSRLENIKLERERRQHMEKQKKVLADALFDIANEMEKGDMADIRWLRDQVADVRDAAHLLLDGAE